LSSGRIPSALEQVQAMNVLYDKMWLYDHFFQPVMHLQEKVWQGSLPGKVTFLFENIVFLR